MQDVKKKVNQPASSEAKHAGHGHGGDDGIMKIALNLMFACMISGLMIAAVFAFTNKTAERKAVELKNEIIGSLVKDADEVTVLDTNEEWHVAKKAGETIAYIVPASSKGYGGSIELLVAVAMDGSVLNYKIVKHNETPGLGDKATKSDFISQYIGKTKDHLVVTKDPSDTEDIMAISGATITSRAVTKAVAEAVDEVVAYIGGQN